MNHIVIDSKLFLEYVFVTHFLGGLLNLSGTGLLVVITSTFDMSVCICRFMELQLHPFMSGDKKHKCIISSDHIAK